MKKITALVLVIILAATIIFCTSCSSKRNITDLIDKTCIKMNCVIVCVDDSTSDSELVYQIMRVTDRQTGKFVVDLSTWQIDVIFDTDTTIIQNP